MVSNCEIFLPAPQIKKVIPYSLMLLLSKLVCVLFKLHTNYIERYFV